MPDASIRSLLDAATKPLLSFEFFPPKNDAGLARLDQTIENLKPTQPDFVTVTYGAGGSTRDRTRTICDSLHNHGFAPVMPHLTCVGSTRDELRELADEIHGAGRRNIMTLRGDPPQGETSFTPPADGLSYAADLVALLKERHSDFCLGVAGYPEVHPEAVSAEADLDNLKRKLDAGADFVTTQLFFDNDIFFDYVEACHKAGITAPILPGILPAVSLKQARRITSMCGAALPADLEKALTRAGDDGDAASDIGTVWIARQMEGLLQAGVPGVHLYILNRERSGIALAIIRQFQQG